MATIVEAKVSALYKQGIGTENLYTPVHANLLKQLVVGQDIKLINLPTYSGGSNHLALGIEIGGKWYDQKTGQSAEGLTAKIGDVIAEGRLDDFSGSGVLKMDSGPLSAVSFELPIDLIKKIQALPAGQTVIVDNVFDPQIVDFGEFKVDLKNNTLVGETSGAKRGASSTPRRTAG